MLFHLLCLSIHLGLLGQDQLSPESPLHSISALPQEEEGNRLQRLFQSMEKGIVVEGLYRYWRQQPGPPTQLQRRFLAYYHPKAVGIRFLPPYTELASSSDPPSGNFGKGLFLMNAGKESDGRWECHSGSGIRHSRVQVKNSEILEEKQRHPLFWIRHPIKVPDVQKVPEEWQVDPASAPLEIRQNLVQQKDPIVLWDLHASSQNKVYLSFLSDGDWAGSWTLWHRGRHRYYSLVDCQVDWPDRKAEAYPSQLLAKQQVGKTIYFRYRLDQLQWQEVPDPETGFRLWANRLPTPILK
ncbi:MAG: hypothetical protein DWQ01_20980 [Planctomycetota bacterium]|nr:MAG: hypothetical protein DWQ01_20980 [Planctomycetota bacterium]